jgi:hypothetical protein
MASEIKANKISPATGTALQISDSGDTTTVPSGATLDVSSATMTGFTIPSGQTLTVASGATVTNSGTASGFGLFSSYAIIADQKAQNTQGGTFTSGAWRTRDLNTEIADPDGIVSIASEQFTLAAGTYLIKWSAPAALVTAHKSRLYNVTDTATVGVGLSAYANDTYWGGSTSSGAARTTIAGSTVFRIEHQCGSTQATYGLGITSNFDTEQYTLVEIFKEA